MRYPPQIRVISSSIQLKYSVISLVKLNVVFCLPVAKAINLDYILI